MEENYIKKKDNEKFIEFVETEVSQIQETSKSQNAKYELLNTTMESRILREVHLSTQHLKKSNMEFEANGDFDGGAQGTVNSRILEEYVKSSHLKQILSEKTSIQEHDMLTR